MQQIVRSILDQARSTAARRAGQADMACGLVAALRRLRAFVGASSGDSGSAEFDDAVRGHVLKRGMVETARIGRPPAPVEIPASGPQAAFASAVLEDAVMSCLGFSSVAPASVLVALCTSALIEALIDTLGGIPDPIALVAQLRPEDGEGAMLATLPSLALQ